MRPGVRSCDVLVVGRGAAGCIASLRLAKAGRDVILVGRETTATSLSTGRIDLRGVENGVSLSTALRELGEGHGLFQAPRGVREAITNCGTIARQSLSSDHDWCDPFEGTVAVMGLEGDPDLDPILMCSALERTRPRLSCIPYRAGLGLPCSIPTGRGAALSEEAAEAVDQIAPVLAELSEDGVVLPPLFGGRNYARALSALERSSGRRVLEPMTPLSNPGVRLQACLEDRAVAAGCEVWNDRELGRLEIDGSSATKAILRSGLRSMSVRPKAVVLATGSVVAGGLSVRGEDVVDPLGMFAMEQAPGNVLSSPSLTRPLSVGVRNVNGKAVLLDGTVLNNVTVAGSAVPGLSYPLGMGLGHAIADAWAKAELTEEAL